MVLIVILRITQNIELFANQWFPTLFVVSSLSMIGGNILALVQTSVKRLLAYSSIAHSGYMALVLCAMGAGRDLPYEAILFYLIGYVLTSVLAFGTLMWLEDTERQNLQIEDLRGLMRSHPWAAFVMAAAMFSFAGMPPTVGFFAKFFIFNAALREHLYFLVIIGALSSVISLYYYLRIVVVMYMQKPDSKASTLTPRSSIVMNVLLTCTCGAVLIFGTVFPEQILAQLKPIATKLSQR